MKTAARPSRVSDPLARIAVVDIGSFVLPYDFHLVAGLQQLGHAVSYFGSSTRYNGEFLVAMAGLPGVRVQQFPVSSSVASRLRAGLGYLRLLWALLSQRRQFDVINLQFCTRWLVELPLFWCLRKQLHYTVHNPVPHGFAGEQHAPTRWMARLAQRLYFPSEFTAEAFYRRYGSSFRAKGQVLQHGVMSVRPGTAAVPYRPLSKPQALVYWSTVKPYKGIELMQALAEAGREVEVHGLWDASLGSVRDGLRRRGALVEDRYLSADELTQLLSRPVVFLLPYLSASQSGALFTLLHAGCVFLATDVGDLGAFLRKNGLEGLILERADVASVDRCLRYLEAHASEVADKLNAAQHALEWSRILVHAGFGPASQNQPVTLHASSGGGWASQDREQAERSQGLGVAEAGEVPLVTVVMPCYNGERYVAEAIRSVQAQTFTDWELRVVDNNSSDGSMAVVRALAQQDSRIVPMHCATPGAAHARNAAIAAARGRYIAFLDCDDAWLPGKLGAQLQALQAHGAAMCWAAYQVVDSAGAVLREQPASASTSYEDHMSKRNVIGCLTVVYDTVLLGKQYMPAIRMRQDYGLWALLIRLAEQQGLALIGLPEVLARYRVHQASMTSNKLKAAYFQWRLYRDVERHSLLRSARYFGRYVAQALADRR